MLGHLCKKWGFPSAATPSHAVPSWVVLQEHKSFSATSSCQGSKPGRGAAASPGCLGRTSECGDQGFGQALLRITRLLYGIPLEVPGCFSRENGGIMAFTFKLMYLYLWSVNLCIIFCPAWPLLDPADSNNYVNTPQLSRLLGMNIIQQSFTRWKFNAR